MRLKRLSVSRKSSIVRSFSLPDLRRDSTIFRSFSTSKSAFSVVTDPEVDPGLPELLFSFSFKSVISKSFSLSFCIFFAESACVAVNFKSKPIFSFSKSDILVLRDATSADVTSLVDPLR